MKFTIFGIVAALSIACFEPSAALAQSYSQCIKGCRGNQGCMDNCENAVNARRERRDKADPRIHQMNCTTDPRTHEQHCHW
jgi:hypothetical protein